MTVLVDIDWGLPLAFYQHELAFGRLALWVCQTLILVLIKVMEGDSSHSLTMLTGRYIDGMGTSIVIIHLKAPGFAVFDGTKAPL